jgi:hypothetical protein
MGRTHGSSRSDWDVLHVASDAVQLRVSSELVGQLTTRHTLGALEDRRAHE